MASRLAQGAAPGTSHPPGQPVLKIARQARTLWGYTQGWGGIALTLVVLCVGLSIAEPTFRTASNLWNVVGASAVLVVLTCGQTIVIISRGIDLSVGAMLAMLSVGIGILLTYELPGYLIIAIVCFGGFIIGLLANGVLIAKVGVSFFVVTLGTMSIFGSIALVLAGGQTVSLGGKPGFELIALFGNGNIGPVPVAGVVALTVFLLTWAMLRWTTFGRAVFAIGNNPEAARLAGIPVARVQMLVFGLSGLIVGVACILYTGRVQASIGTVGTGLELQAIAAVLLGGVSFAGGSGSVVGALLGAALLGVLSNGLNLIGVGGFWQGTATGVILILAVYLDRVRRRQT